MTDPTQTSAAVPTPPAKRRFGLVWMVGAVAVGAVLVTFAGRYERAPPPEPILAAGLSVEKGSVILESSAKQWKHVKLGTAMTAEKRLTPPMPARVRIDERKATRVGVPFDGRVIAVEVELGQRVKQGAPLFTLTSPALAELMADREKALVSLAAARKALTRTQELVAAGILPAKEEITATQVVKEAEVDDRRAESKLQSVRAASGSGAEFVIRAPRDGVVVEKNVLLGQEVVHGGSEALMVVADLSTVWIQADVFEADATGLKEGALATITSPAIPELHLEGKVDLVSAVVDQDRQTIPVRIRLPNPTGVLRPNLYAQVQFERVPPPGAVEIPTSALVTNGSDQYVYVQVQPGKFNRRAVVAGFGRGPVLPIYDGLRAGETVVEDGALLLDNQVSLSD